MQQETETCLNCDAPMTGVYCWNCGQKRRTQDPTFREFLHETTHELTDWDGKVPRTLKALLLKPGLLTVDYLAGRRERWLRPLRLYLLSSLLFFVTGPVVERITHRSARAKAQVTITDNGGNTTLTPEVRQQIAEGLPGRLFGVERIERAAVRSGELNQTIRDSYPKAMFVLLPLFALFTSIAWRNRRRGYPAHLYLALHLHAAWFFAFTAVTIFAGVTDVAVVQGIVAAIVFLYIVWYTLVAVRRVFGDSWPKSVAKTLGVAIVYAPCWLLASLSMLAYAVWSM